MDLRLQVPSRAINLGFDMHLRILAVFSGPVAGIVELLRHRGMLAEGDRGEVVAEELDSGGGPNTGIIT